MQLKDILLKIVYFMKLKNKTSVYEGIIKTDNYFSLLNSKKIII